MSIVKLIASIITLPQAIRNEVNIIKIKQEIEHKHALINLGVNTNTDWDNDPEL